MKAKLGFLIGGISSAIVVYTVRFHNDWWPFVTCLVIVASAVALFILDYKEDSMP